MEISRWCGLKKISSESRKVFFFSTPGNPDQKIGRGRKMPGFPISKKLEILEFLARQGGKGAETRGPWHRVCVQTGQDRRKGGQRGPENAIWLNTVAIR